MTRMDKSILIFRRILSESYLFQTCYIYMNVNQGKYNKTWYRNCL